jgi:hypothetical protein
MEKILSEMFEDGIFSNIFYAEENSAIINIEKTIKEDGKLKTITESNTYSLTSLKVNNEDDIKYSLLHNFFVKLNYDSNRKEIKYFNRGFLRNLFTKRNIDVILDEILTHSWVITTPNIIKELSKIEGFEYCEGNKLVKLRGRFNCQFHDTLIFELPSNNINAKLYTQFTENVIYCGNFDSVTPVINRNKIVEKDGIRIEYIFHTKDNLKKLIIT